MLNFRNDILRLATKYPGIIKVSVSPEMWSEICESFDIQLREEKGTTEQHIKDKSGKMQFDQLIVEPVNEE